MAIDVTLDKPDETPPGGSQIVLKAVKVTEKIAREVRNTVIVGNKTIAIDLGRPRKTFTVKCNLHSSGALDKTQLEALEDAAMNWYNVGSGSTRGKTIFTWGTKASGDKRYSVIIKSLDVIEDVNNAPTMYQVTIVLEETSEGAKTLSTSGEAQV